MKRTHAAIIVALLAPLSPACGATDSTTPEQGTASAPKDAGVASVADIRADSNRDGQVRFDDTSDADKTTWDKTHGAIFLANIDDDLEACKNTKNDTTIANCNDAADEQINGEDDVLDLAPLKTKPWAEAPEGTTATISVTSGNPDLVRIFKKTGEGVTDFTVLAADEALTVDEVRSGLELAIEAKDIVRDTDAWDGFVTVEYKVTTPDGESADAVKLRVSPVMTYHHLLQAEEVFVTDSGTEGNSAMREGLTEACTSVSLPKPTMVSTDDSWTQDFFEPAFMSMPDGKGGQHAIHVNYRSANVFSPKSKTGPLREAGRYVFSDLRGKDSAGIQQFDVKHSQDMDSLNSFGNTETIPPYTLGANDYPLGRLLRGKTESFYPDPTFTKMLESQGQQPPVYIDTSWLLVGHVDETVSFVKAATPRGWVLLVNDARLAKTMLEEQVTAGNGEVPMFVGKQWYDDNGSPSVAETTINAVLADTDVMQASAEAAVEVDGQLAKIKAETGLTDDEIIRIPYLHHTYAGLSVAYQPGTVNGIYISDTHFVAPDPHGPVIDGKDIFRENFVSTLAKIGITAHFAEDWDDYHAALGEVHCGSNTRRKIPEVKWWETGR